MAQQAVYDDFLKRTGAGDAPAGPRDTKSGTSAAKPDYSDFLRRTGANDDAPAAPAGPAMADPAQNEYGITGDPQQFNEAKGPEIAQPVVEIAKAAAEGAKAGFGSDPVGLSDAHTQAMREAGLFNQPGQNNPLRAANEALIGGAAAGGDLLLRGGNALVGAYQRGVSQAGTEIGAPQLGRDLAALPEAFPTGDTAGGLRLPAPVEPGPPVNRLAATPADLARIADDHTMSLQAPLPAAFRDNPGVVTPSNVGAVEPNRLATPVPQGWAVDDRFGPGTPGAPQGAGSANALTDTAEASGANAAGAQATPGALTDMTPKQVQAYRSNAEGRKLLESQQPGIPDATAYVPGVSASTAEIEQTVNAARDAKSANMAHPEVSQAAQEQADANNAARQQYLENTVRSKTDIDNADAARAAQAERDLAATWRNKTDADAQPVADVANEIQASPDGRRPLVRNAVNSVISEMTDANGKLLTDPEQLYGVRKHLDDLLSKEARADDPKSVRAQASLMQLKGTLDDVIEAAAPGFKQYLANFTEASKPIDEMEALQGHEHRLYDSKGRLQLSRVQTMMRNIVDARASPGINPYKSISDETMQRLWNLRDDLRRSASSQELARTAGSDTAQNLMDLAKRSVVVGGRIAAHGVANSYFPVLGSLGVNAADAALSNRMAASAQRKSVAAGMRNLNPNRLVPPRD